MIVGAFYILLLTYAGYNYLGSFGAALCVVATLAWARLEMRPLPCPITRHATDKELNAIWPEFIKAVENPLFERMLWWVLPRCICINRFFFHDIPGGGVCPIDGIEASATDAELRRFDYLAFHLSTLLFVHRTIYNELAERKANGVLA
ncbi:hypothetical protein IWW39_005583 [Coemansia spiralis]|uniref:Uncharacterized protein n=1 Tax=Coemansia spiralis TaxID=417178 RepID=A0A9W8GF55_9FUNG|nr:hypothetical protein IWW39_005583 [Coemansia spiralis]